MTSLDEIIHESKDVRGVKIESSIKIVINILKSTNEQYTQCLSPICQQMEGKV
jgi:hypothetical protein